tara:strand:- start:679 stop:930 length:252 start_codon:yes stop_codon:yes gene_type:complete
MRVKTYNGTFVKTSGEDRTMSFVRIGDLPANFLNGKVSSNAKPRKLAEGVELVWDIVSKDFRIFNHNTVVGQVSGPQDMEIIA